MGKTLHTQISVVFQSQIWERIKHQTKKFYMVYNIRSLHQSVFHFILYCEGYSMYALCMLFNLFHVVFCDLPT